MCISQYNKETSTYHRRSYCPRAISGRPPLDVILGCTQFTPLQPVSLRSILMPFFYLIPCVPSNYSTVTLWSFVIGLCATYLFNPPLLPQLSVVYFFLTSILITISHLFLNIPNSFPTKILLEFIFAPCPRYLSNPLQLPQFATACSYTRSILLFLSLPYSFPTKLLYEFYVSPCLRYMSSTQWLSFVCRSLL